ncbi:integrase [Streptacidiphilus sp. MAP12-20]|uniref:tyrosine-type recombinase/integrase n=1 Tax=Streptacidiphilus sp. MAP12-20 TaxID=3156299 RepID=UPI0035188653
MASVYDRWHKSRPKKGEAECPEHKGKVASAEHGIGMRWQVRYRDPVGTPRKEPFGRKVDADRRAAELSHHITTGKFVDPAVGKETFREVAERWREVAVHDASTVERVERALRLHILPILGDYPIASIRTSDLQAWVKDRAGHLAPSTLKVTWSYITATFRLAELDRQVGFNPCRGVKLPAVRRREIVPLTVNVVAAIVNAPPGWYRAMLLLAAASGLRQGELFGMEVGDLDFRAGTVRVRQQLISPDVGEPYLAEPKTHESYRTVPVAKTAMDALAAHLKQHPARRVDVEDRTNPRKPKRRKALLVFTNERSEAIRRASWASVWANVEKVADKALREAYEGAVKRWERRGRPEGSEPVLEQVPAGSGMHDLRHFYASVLIKHRESVKTVQVRLGHSKPSITLDIYTHLWPNDEDTTRAAVESVLTGVPSLCPVAA